MVRTEEVKKEIVSLYLTQPNTTVKEIRRTYRMSLASIYRILDAANIPRRGSGTPPKRTIVPQVTTVKVDKEDFVQEVAPVIRKGDQWVVKYTAEVTVEAESIDQALMQVRKLGTARRIYSIRLK